MDAECVSQLAESGAVWTPTLATIGNLIGCGRYPDDVLRPLLALQMENVAECVRQGGTVAAGSDAGAYLVPHCKGIADEVALLRRAIGENADAELVRARERGSPALPPERIGRRTKKPMECRDMDARLQSLKG